MTDTNSSFSQSIAQAEVKVNNKLGLHARPAARLVQLSQNFDAEIKICSQDAEANAKSILDILSLSASSGAILTLKCKGVDASKACSSLVDFFQNFTENFDG